MSARSLSGALGRHSILTYCGGTQTIRPTTVPIIALALLAIGCSQHHENSQNPKDHSAYLYVHLGAKNIRYVKMYGRDDVYYELEEEFPAKTFIANLDEYLKRNGFEVQEYDMLNPTIPTSYYQGWSCFVDGTKNPNRMVQQWLTDWKNINGEYLAAALRYTWPDGKPKNSNNLEVYLMFMPKGVADAMRK